jgi:signal peptidase I
MKRRSLVPGVIGLILASLLLIQPYKLVVVVGRSMLPTLKGGQILLAKKTNKFERGDIVVIKEEDNIIIKRIKYLPEEYYYSVLDFETTEMVVIENDFREMMLGIEKYGLDNIKEYKLAKNSYFVLGDNSTESDDSRRFGPIHKEQILYKVIR